MRKILLATFVLATATAAAAHPAYHYTGGCELVGSYVGTTWTGAANVTVQATDTAGVPVAVPITAECVLSTNGVPHPTSVVAAASTTGFATGTNPTASFTVVDPETDTVVVCARVVVGGVFHDRCDDL